ncbi:MAG: divergent PAP2 family protein [Chloroflexi bacterium]|nr:divergent PAP2 family protein [Chloroflexota bacterium]
MDRLFDNRVLVAAALAWLIAQTSKLLILILRERHVQLRVMTSSGGMPSSHSALVTALATGIGLTDGVHSTLFAIAVVFAAVVLYDAAGVRRAVSHQAMIINRMLEEAIEFQRFSEKRLLELLGHTPFEVFVGMLLGIATALSVV